MWICAYHYYTCTNLNSIDVINRFLVVAIIEVNWIAPKGRLMSLIWKGSMEKPPRSRPRSTKKFKNTYSRSLVCFRIQNILTILWRHQIFLHCLPPAVVRSLGKRGKRRLLYEIFRKIEVLFTVLCKNSVRKKLLRIRIISVTWSLSYQSSSVMAYYLIHYFNYFCEVKFDFMIVD